MLVSCVVNRVMDAEVLSVATKVKALLRAGGYEESLQAGGVGCRRKRTARQPS
jgi:hypothetical protein